MKVTVITVCYNALLDLKQTLDNVLMTKNVDYDIVVIDGNSDDGTKEFLDDASITRLTYISEPDNGIYDAMNKGVLLATGEYVIFMNAGDLFYSEFSLSTLVSSFDNDNVDVVIGNAVMSNGFVKEHKLSFWYVLRNSICHQAMLIKKDSLINFGGYDLSFKISSDNDFLIKNIHIFKISLINQIVCIYDVNGISSDKKNRRNIWLEKKNTYKNSNIPLAKKIFAVLFCNFILVWI